MFLRAIAFLLLIIVSVTTYASDSNIFSNPSATPSFLNDNQPKFLPADAAFSFIPTKKDEKIELTWLLSEGYYLYQHQFKFKLASDSAIMQEIKFPNAIAKNDDVLGDYFIYKNQVTLNVELEQQSYPVTLLVQYQGCAADGYCYPPVAKKLTVSKNSIDIIEIKPFAEAIGFFNPDSNADTKQSNQVAAIEQQLQDGSIWYIALAFFGFGVLLAFTPCVLPMVPILANLIIGHKQLSSGRSLLLSATYVIAVAATYAVLGVAVGLAGENLQASMQHPYVIIGFSIILTLLALSQFGAFNLKLPAVIDNKLQNMQQQQQGGSVANVFIMGILAALIVSPCVTPPLIGALSYIAHSGDAATGAVSLFALGLGMGAPLVIAATIGGKYLPSSGAWLNTVKNIFGILLLGLVVWLLERIVFGPATLAMWGGLAIFTSLQLGITSVTHSFGNVVKQTCAIIILIYGAIMIVGASIGNNDPFNPLNVNYNNTPQTKANFIKIKSTKDVEQQLQTASSSQLVMLDFYADWCVSCKIIEKKVFADNEVQSQLQSVILLQADVTANDEIDKALQQSFGVFAPPMVLFFKDGAELANSRLVGEFSKKQFLHHLQQLR